MGNCQAAEAATVVIVHPGNSKVDRIYWSVSARQVMTSNPGHYVALVINSPKPRSENGTRVKQLKLLRPDDTLLIGQVYRLVSFEDVLKEFATKKCVKLGKLLKESGGLRLEVMKGMVAPTDYKKPKPAERNDTSVKVEHEQVHRLRSNSSNGGSSVVTTRSHHHHNHHHHYNNGGRQWKPALQSIAEVGTR